MTGDQIFQICEWHWHRNVKWGFFVISYMYTYIYIYSYAVQLHWHLQTHEHSLQAFIRVQTSWLHMVLSLWKKSVLQKKQQNEPDLCFCFLYFLIVFDPFGNSFQQHQTHLLPCVIAELHGAIWWSGWGSGGESCFNFSQVVSATANISM